MSQLGWVGSLRVGILYISGVVLGVLGASVTEPKKFLLGASAGVYALIFAHLGTWKVLQSTLHIVNTICSSIVFTILRGSYIERQFL